MTDSMNVIFLLCDTIVKAKISPYHNRKGPYGHVRTPNMDRLASRSATFTNHWINSAPCMPARRDLFSGRIEFPWRSWGPRETFDPDWTLKLKQTDVSTFLFTDHGNLFDTGASNYHHFFDAYYYERGHLNDHFRVADQDKLGRIYKSVGNSTEDETFVARNLSNVAKWLDEHSETKKPFFIFIDEFDPHWPLDPPEPYKSMYLGYHSPYQENDGWFHSGNSENYTPGEINWMQSQYEGKLTMVDRWIGEILERMDKYNLWKDTVFILTTDHGEFLGEYGQMSKGAGFSYPLFANIPLIIHYPGSPLSGEKVNELTCSVDLNATVLDIFGLKAESRSHGVSFLPLLRHLESVSRHEVLYGWWGKGFYWTDGKFLLCKAPENPGPLYQYGVNLGEKYVGLAGAYFDRYAGAEAGRFLPHTDQIVFRIPSDGLAYSGRKADFDALFNLNDDPLCTQNIYSSRIDLRNQCVSALAHAMEKLQAPGEHYQRLGLLAFKDNIY